MILFYYTFIKLVLGIFCLIFQINLMGKGNLAPSTAMDQVQNYVLGGIIGGVIYNKDITVLQFFLILVIWTLLIFTLKFIKNHNRYIKYLLDGKPVTLILNGKVLTDECMKSGITANDLTFKLRTLGIYHIHSLKRVVLQENGQLSIITVNDKDDIKYPIVIDGQINFDVLEIINKDEDWIINEIEKQGFTLSQIYIAEYIYQKIFIYPYGIPLKQKN
ncbi:Protein of uncharacterised function (DUF421) [Sebaldella termitidis]|uniref:Membrane protein yetF n=1 Tax=Sebaldella termitidis (strain ATCC 33386 / NCTC 11300) TaxID=526218 RepID=D1AHC8_SEBTE|nr:DUF421 domain-containing protein [Sebaldella termitidis]ACZ08162.1 protein of unknown function DUF421 [Sebaldella termitidis ATCC 33386]SUI23464.1 Protein of uncharacterised function (DUF421) [Sebaldella termitidis]